MSKTTLVFRKRNPNNDFFSFSKFKLEIGGGSQNVNPTCDTYGNKNFGKFLVGTRGSFGYCKDGQKVKIVLQLRIEV